MILTYNHGPFLIISGHDYRSKRKVDIHFIANKLVQRGTTRIVSVGFSRLSRMKADPRLSLWHQANRMERHAGADCFLWRTILHPFNLKFKWLNIVTERWFMNYARQIPALIRNWIAESRVIMIESGFPVALIPIVRELSPMARLIYLASDDLTTIGCAPFLQELLIWSATLFDSIRVPARALAKTFPPCARVHYIPHGIEQDIFDIDVASPYPLGQHVVSVGSMLFDPTFFTLAALALPHVTFHVIGGGAHARELSGSNIVVYGEMPFRDTIAYLKHAEAGIAPYDGRHVAPYLTDSSMKLQQFGYLGIPAVCPDILTGGQMGRFGYTPGNQASIVQALNKALSFGHFPGLPCLGWAEVTERILHPDKFADTQILSLKSDDVF